MKGVITIKSFLHYFQDSGQCGSLIGKILRICHICGWKNKQLILEVPFFRLEFLAKMAFFIFIFIRFPDHNYLCNLLFIWESCNLNIALNNSVMKKFSLCQSFSVILYRLVFLRIQHTLSVLYTSYK